MANEIKVVQGNSFWLKCDVTKRIIGGSSTEAFPLDQMKDMVVRLVNLGGIKLPISLDTTTSGRMYLHCVGIPLGTYKLELTGRFHENPVRSAELHMVQIVDHNSQGTTPSGTYQGEDSYNIDLAVTLYNGVGVEEAPNDGKQYVRKNRVWEELDSILAKKASVENIDSYATLGNPLPKAQYYYAHNGEPTYPLMLEKDNQRYVLFSARTGSSMEEFYVFKYAPSAEPYPFVAKYTLSNVPDWVKEPFSKAGKSYVDTELAKKHNIISLDDITLNSLTESSVFANGIAMWNDTPASCVAFTYHDENGIMYKVLDGTTAKYWVLYKQEGTTKYKCVAEKAVMADLTSLLNCGDVLKYFHDDLPSEVAEKVGGGVLATEDDIASEAIKGRHLASNSVTTGKIAPNTILDNDINPTAFDDNLATSRKLADAKVVGDALNTKASKSEVNEIASQVSQKADADYVADYLGANIKQTYTPIRGAKQIVSKFDLKKDVEYTIELSLSVAETADLVYTGLYDADGNLLGGLNIGIGKTNATLNIKPSADLPNVVVKSSFYFNPSASQIVTTKVTSPSNVVSKEELEDVVEQTEFYIIGVPAVGTIYDGYVWNDPNCLCYKEYFEVESSSTLKILLASGLKIKVTEYNEQKVYIKSSAYSTTETSYELSDTTKFVRLSASYYARGYSSSNPITTDAYTENDFAIIVKVKDKVTEIASKLSIVAEEQESIAQNVDELEERVDGAIVVVSENKNIFNEDMLLEIDGATLVDGVYSFLTRNAHLKYGFEPYLPLYDIPEEGAYTLSMKVSQTDSVYCLSVGFVYDDGTITSDVIKTTTGGDTFVLYKATSNAQKRLKAIILSYGNNKQVSVKEVQLEKGTTNTEYVKCVLFNEAKDKTARTEISLLDEEVETFKEDVYGVLCTDYVENVSTGGVRVVTADLKSGKTYRFSTYTDEGIEHQIYFGVRSASGNTLVSGGYHKNGKTVSDNILTLTPEQDYVGAFLYVSAYDGAVSKIYGKIECDGDITKLNNLIKGNETDILSLNPKKDVSYLMRKLFCKSFYEGTKNENKTTFLHFSDLHANTANLERINIFRNEYASYIDECISSGDQISSMYSNDWTFWTNKAKDVLLCIGNHEVWNSQTTQEREDIATDAECYTKYFQTLSNWGLVSGAYTEGKCYYYKDYDSGVRLVVIDSLHWDSAQEQWFTNVLADAKTNGKTIVGMGHYTLGNSGAFQFDDDCSFCSLERSSSGSGYSPASITTGRVSAETILLNYINGGGKFAVWLCGHTHNDFFGLSENGIPTIVIEQATSKRCGSDNREDGTKSQDSFNILTIDVTNMKFYVLRIGNDVDKMMRSKKLLCYDYANKKVLWNS